MTTGDAVHLFLTMTTAGLFSGLLLALVLKALD